jgi:hypothetical protein
VWRYVTDGRIRRAVVMDSSVFRHFGGWKRDE